MLTRRNDQALEFDFAKVTEQSKDNPVFYVQYAHARAASVMRHAFEHLFARGFKRVILIGGDLPALPLAILNDAFASLQSKDCEVVLGPSIDGGYYLVGMNELVADIFADIEWSRNNVLAMTLEKLNALNKKYKLVGSWYDIDTIDDLRRLELDCGPESAGSMKKTSTLLQKFKQGGKLK